nr:PREDICTED: spermatid-specific manchette-related protein 1 [Equus przewalskii]
MFLFSRKTKTPISTYSDSYRAPTSIKEVYKDPPLWAWEANKFVTPGLTQTTQRHVDPEALRKMVKCAVQDYTYKGSVPGHPYLPEKYWLSQEEADKCTPNYLCSNRYNTRRMGPYNYTGWNKYATCLPRLPKGGDRVGRARRAPASLTPPQAENLIHCARLGKGEHKDCIALRSPARNAVCCYNSPAVILPMSEP